MREEYNIVFECTGEEGTIKGIRTWITYGSKRDFNGSLIQEVKRGGYQTCLLNIHGYNHLKPDSFCFRRIIMDEYMPLDYLLG